jgi:hypothetical protein
MQLPRGKICQNNQLCCNWTKWGRDNSIRDVNIINDMKTVALYTIGMMDCNAEWVPGNSVFSNRMDYMEVLAAKVRVTCNNYRLWTNKININAQLVSDVVSIVEETYNVNLIRGLHSLIELPSSSNACVRVENTPRCPNCGAYLVLSWMRYQNSDGDYLLMWKCPNYNDKNCKDKIVKIWGTKMCPPLITMDKVYFHNWELDGFPIPVERLVQPLTIYSLSGHYSRLMVSIPGRDNEGDIMSVKITRGRGHKLMTEEQESFLRDTYSEFGTFAVMVKYPEMNLKHSQICQRASAMGLKQRRGSPGKRMIKLINR